MSKANDYGVVENSAYLLLLISKSTHTDNFDLIKKIIAIPKFELAMQGNHNEIFKRK